MIWLFFFAVHDLSKCMMLRREKLHESRQSIPTQGQVPLYNLILFLKELNLKRLSPGLGDNDEE